MMRLEGRGLLGKLLSVGFALVLSGVVTGYKKPEDQAVNLPENKQQLYLDVANELRCPTCVGLSVLESDAPFSEQIKSIVREQVTAGKSESEILDFFTARYGPWILRSPPKAGFNMVAWILPVLVLVLGPLGLWLGVWRRRRFVPVTQGVRPSDEIVGEMHVALDAMRAERGRSPERGSRTREGSR